MTTTSPESTSALPQIAYPEEEHDRPVQTDKRSIWSSIRFKATLLAIMIGTLPVIAIGGVAYYFANQSFTQKVASEQQFKTTELADKLNLFMFERFGDIQVLANLPFLNDPKIQAITTLQDRKTTLDKYAETYEVYDNIVVADLNGNVILEAGKEKTLSNIAFQDYFKAARNGQIYVTGRQSIFWAAPLRNKVTNEIIGVVRTRMPSNRLDRLAQAYTEGNQEYLFADETGRIFASKQAESLERDSALLFPGLDKLAAQKQSATIFPTPTQLVGYAPIKKFENMPFLGWSVLTVADPDTTFRVQRDLLLTLTFGTAIAALLVGSLATWIASQGTRPITQATAAVEKLGQGELDTRIPVRGSDELAILGTNINQMAEQIQTLLGDVRKSAAEVEQQKEAVIQESEVLQTDVGNILDVVSALEDGDMTVQAEVSDRMTGLVSDTLNRLIEQLGQTLSQVLSTAQQVTEGAKNLENMNAIVAGNSGEQSQSIADVLTLTENVEKIARESSENVVKSNQSLLSARSVVADGQVSMASLTDGFEVLQQGMTAIAKRTEELQAFIDLADQFAQEQSQVASMTQMLSLSADQLGAKALAQDDPKEFRMSALEFKAIANQISELSKQAFAGLSSLKQRSGGVQTLVVGVNKEVKDLANLVASFNEIVTQSIQAFANVQDTTEQVVQVGNTVEQSSQEIVATSRSTAQAMRNIAQLAERTAQLTQTTRTQSEAMGDLSDRLLKNIQFFRLPESTESKSQAISSTQQDEPFVLDSRMSAPKTSKVNSNPSHVSNAEGADPSLSLVAEL